METTVQAFRRFNRFYTRVLGLFNRRLFNTPLTLAQARILFEIRAAPGVAAARLSQDLGMDRGQLSRILSRLLGQNLIQRKGTPGGRKTLPLFPTALGKKVLAQIENAADRHAASLMRGLDDEKRRRLTAALEEVQVLLGEKKDQPQSVVVRRADLGDLGRIITRHAEIYGQEYGFTYEFETYVLLGLADYVKKDPGQSRVWMAEQDGIAAGSVGIVALDANQTQLRWLLVEPGFRGMGVGKKLVNHALRFCRGRGFGRVILWTLKDLTAARALYASVGFKLAEEKQGQMGGRAMMEERWALDLI